MTQDFPKVAEGFVCPTQWDETMKASDPLFGTGAEYNKEMKASPTIRSCLTRRRRPRRRFTCGRTRSRGRTRSTRKSCATALQKTDLKTFYGEIKFAPDGSNPGKEILLRQIQNGKYKLVWPTAVAAAKINYPRKAQY